MNSKWRTLLISPKSGILFIIAHFFFLFLVFRKDFYAGIVGSFISLGVFYAFLRMSHILTNEMKNKPEQFPLEMDFVLKESVLLMNFPIILISEKGELLWRNTSFKQIFSDDFDVKGLISGLALQINDDHPSKGGTREILEEVAFEGRYFKIYGRNLGKVQGEESNVLLLCFFDDSEKKALKKSIEDEKPVVGVLVIDNYDELMGSMEDSKRPQMLAEIDAKVVSWSSHTGGILKKYERDKYLWIFQRQYLKEFENKRYDLLEQVKEISLGNKIPVTISIGIDNTGESLNKSLTYAMASLEIALGRGGDQVVLKTGQDIQFFGGKTREVEKRTKVKARVISHALKEVINNSEQVLIMGHANYDMDCLGAAIGIYKIAEGINKKVNIVLDKIQNTIQPFMEKLSEKENYEGIFINKSEAIDMITKNTLLVVVDTHRPNYTECPELLKHTRNVVVIDHHRRGTEFIQDAVLTYHEPYASSTCELVTEIIQYIDEYVKLDAVEAELLYAGIFVDTKGFIFKTGVRTFEAAAYLRRKGVDTIEVKQLLQSDLETFINVSNIVKEVRIYQENIAIAICPPQIKNSALIAAQAADLVLGIAGISASFIITDTGNGIFISGRSFGDINVQVVLEKIGGGGHQTVAGAQFYNMDVESVEKKLKEAIDTYLKELIKEH